MPSPKHHEEAPWDLGKALFEPSYLFFLLIVSDHVPWQMKKKKMVTLPARKAGLVFCFVLGFVFVCFCFVFWFLIFVCVCADVQSSPYYYCSYLPPDSDLIIPPLLWKPFAGSPWFRIRSALWSVAFDTLLHLSPGSFLQDRILPLLCPSLHCWLAVWSNHRD